MTDNQTRTGLGARGLEFRGDHILRPDQDNVQVGMTIQTLDRRRHRDMGTVIPTHDVDRDSDIAHAA
jgi:hypothetical protein